MPLKKTRTILISCLIILCVSNIAFAACCPYCGKQYGEPAPGDEARVYALRRQHEAECSRRHGGRASGGGGGMDMEMAMMSAFTNAIIQAIPTPQQLEQQRIAEASAINNRGVDYENSGNLNAALNCYEQSVRMDPDNYTAQENLRRARSRKAFQTAEDYILEQDWDMAIKYYKEAISWDDTEDNRFHLEMAEKYKKDDRPRQEKMKELNKSKNKIHDMLNDLSSQLETDTSTVDLREPDSSLEFVTAKDPLYTKGSKSSAPAVDLSGAKKAEIPTIKPSAAISAKVASQSMSYPEDKTDVMTSVARTGLILDALEQNKGDWEQSILSLEKDAHKTGKPSSAHQQAISYLEGMQCYENLAISKAKEAAYLNAGFSEDVDDNFSLFEEPGTGSGWPGLKTNTMPENPYDWKLSRAKVVADMLEEHKDNLTTSIRTLEKKAINNPENNSIRNALHFLRGYDGYQTFATEGQSKK